MAADENESVSRLVRTGFLALGGEAPRRHRMTTAGGAAFAATVRMVDRVHGHAAVVRHAALPALAASLADRDVHVVGVGHRADRRHAVAVDEALFGRVQTDD